MLGARIAVHIGNTLESGHLLSIAQQAIASSSDGGTLGRQLLRFATDCYQLAPTADVFGIMAGILLRLADAGDAKRCPALARYAVASAADAAPDVSALPPYADLFERARASMLPTLLGKLSPGTTDRLAQALAAWAPELIAAGADEQAFSTLLLTKRPTRPQTQQEWYDAWYKRLPMLRDKDIDILAALFTTTFLPTSRLLPIYRALLPGPDDRTPESDPFLEARRLGDLLPAASGDS
jgi:hypothetical protein